MSLNTETANKENITNETIPKGKQGNQGKKKYVEKQAKENKELADKILSENYFDGQDKEKQSGAVIDEDYDRATNKATKMMDSIREATIAKYGVVKDNAQQIGKEASNETQKKKQQYLQGDSMKFQSAEEARAKGQEIGQKIIERVCQGAETFKEKTKQTGEWIQNNFNQTFVKAQDKLDQEVQPESKQDKKQLQKKKNQLKDDAKNMKEKSEQKLEQGKKIIEKKGQGFIQKTEQIIEQIYEKAANLADSAAKSIGIKEKTEEQKLKENAQKLTGKQTAGKSNESLLDMTTRIASEAIQIAKEKGSQAWKYTKQSAQNLVEGAKIKAEEISETPQQANEKLKAEMGLKSEPKKND